MEKVLRILDSITISKVLEARLVVVTNDYVHLQILAGDAVVAYYSIDVLHSTAEYKLKDIGSGRADNGTYFVSLRVIYGIEHLNAALTYGEGGSTLYSMGSWTKSKDDACYRFSEARQEFVIK